jgi:hypothetical protein
VYKVIFEKISSNDVVALPRYVNTVLGHSGVSCVVVYAPSMYKNIIFLAGNTDGVNIQPTDRITGTLG